MRFLTPAGGDIPDYIYGVMTTPAHKGIPAGIVSGKPWAGDNGAFTGKIQPDDFIAWLNGPMLPYKESCLFVVAPDIWGNAPETLKRFSEWQPVLAGWPIAYAAQDGQENLSFPPVELWSCLFVGGSDKWRLSPACPAVIEKARLLGKHIHIGRINWGRKYRYFRGLPGSDHFTCDGTRTRYEGVSAAHKAWRKLENEPVQKSLRLYLPGSGHRR